jgi:hypothetical protein
MRLHVMNCLLHRCWCLLCEVLLDVILSPLIPVRIVKPAPPTMVIINVVKLSHTISQMVAERMELDSLLVLRLILSTCVFYLFFNFLALGTLGALRFVCWQVQVKISSLVLGKSLSLCSGFSCLLLGHSNFSIGLLVYLINLGIVGRKFVLKFLCLLFHFGLSLLLMLSLHSNLMDFSIFQGFFSLEFLSLDRFLSLLFVELLEFLALLLGLFCLLLSLLNLGISGVDFLLSFLLGIGNLLLGVCFRLHNLLIGFDINL